MRFHLKSIPDKSHSDPISNDGALLGFFEDGRSNKTKKMISDMGSVPDPKQNNKIIKQSRNTAFLLNILSEYNNKDKRKQQMTL